MEDKTIIWWGMILGSIVGGFIPSLWGASSFSLWGVLFTALGGSFGIWVGYRMTH